MIKITIQDLHRDSPRCLDACGKYRVEGCSSCNLRFRTVHKCPHCGVIKHFYGANNPLNCAICKRAIPDAYALQVEGSHARVRYHLAEAI